MTISQRATTIAGKPVESVGVIMVHGIGEQRRFEHLECETRKIVDAIIANYGKRRRDVTITLTTGQSDEFQSRQSSWASGATAPLHAVAELDDKVVDIAFHEVWWADVNERLTLGKQFRFWLWGLALPGVVTQNGGSPLPGARQTRPPANAGKLTWWHRIRLAYVSVLFAFSAFSIAFANVILKRLDFGPVLSTGVIVNYLSGVKLYSQDTRAGGSPMDGPDEPPRAAIRRRIIRTMVDVASAGYERWYILAHSLGSIVAWNGVMEIDRALPNYLSETQWTSPVAADLHGSSARPFNVNSMMPNRPVWLSRHETIDRDALFANFRGLLTYGAPLERFCALWSNMVPINLHEDPFPEDVEWINVYDPTDPVAAWTSDFDPKGVPRGGHGMLKPRNFLCRASPILLLSHISYLTSSRLNALRLVGDRPNQLVTQVAHWLVQGDSLGTRLERAPKGWRSFWMPLTRAGRPGPAAYVRAVSRYLQWLVVGGLLTVLTLFSLHEVILPIFKGVLRWLGFAVF